MLYSFRLFFLKTLALFLAKSCFALVFLNSCLHYGKKSHPPAFDQKLEDLPLFPLNGDSFRLSELKDAKGLMIILRDKDCPGAKQQAQKVLSLERQYAPQGIKFIYAYAGAGKHKAKEDLKSLNSKSPYITDKQQKWAEALKAQSANETFVLTPVNPQVIYRGPLLEQTEQSLKALIAGQSPAPVALQASRSCPIPQPLIKEKVFFEDTAPLIAKKCAVCHNPQGTGPMDFINYRDITGRGQMFRYVIKNHLMPPWHLDPNTGPWRDNLSLTAYEKALLLKWAKQGFPRKSQKDHLQELYQKIPIVKNEKKWDYTLKLPKTVEVPKGARPRYFSDYKSFVIRPGFKSDKWIRGVKIIQKPKVIHHINLFMMNPYLSDKQLHNIQNNYERIVENAIAFFVSGNDSNLSKINAFLMDFKNLGIFFPKNSAFIMVIHYESPGQKIIDNETSIKFLFHKQKPKQKIVFHTLDKAIINIPPYESNYKSVLRRRLEHNLKLIALGPHMHYRGKAASIYVTAPSGKRKKLFGMDPWLLKGQEHLYNYQSPVKLKKGSILECVNRFDNSAANPQNPDPSKEVHLGVSEHDEMSQCYFVFTAPVDSPVKNLFLTVP